MFLALTAALYVRLSVCLSVTLVSHAYIVQDIVINFTPYDKVMFLVS